jgi:hypothetical protein
MKNKTFTPLFRDVKRAIHWLIQGSKPELIGLLPLIDKLLSNLDIVYRSRGKVSFVLYIKSVRTVWLNFLSGNIVKTDIKSTHDGLPFIFGDLIHIIRKGQFPVSLLQIINTILFCTRSLKQDSIDDTSTITGPPSKEFPLYLSKHINSFWKDLGYGTYRIVPKSCLFKSFKLSTSAGPVTKLGNATWTSLCDLFSLDSESIRDIKTLGGPKMVEAVDTLLSSKSDIIPLLGLPTSVVSPLRRLVSFGDKELKVRVVAILDYFSQSSLRRLHSWIFRILKGISQDCTFDQGAFVDKFHSPDWVFYSSVDLKAATDRLPIQLMILILKGRFPDEYVDAWARIMVRLPFVYRNKMISYSVGNPMGAYTSFAMLGLSHHYIMYHCCKELGLSWRRAPYFLVGDDIVIGNRDLAKLYKQVIVDLGVEFSILKTYESPHFFEFTKRIFWRGNEISPFPFSALKNEGKFYYLLTNLLLEWESRGYQFVDGVSSGVQLYYGMVRSLPSRMKSDVKIKSYVCELIIKIINGDLSALELNQALEALGYTYSPPLCDLECKSILENIVVESFANSNPASNIKSKRKCVGLGPLAIHLVMILTGLPDNLIERGLLLIYNLPILNSYSRIEEFYTKLSRKAFTMKEWPLALKTMAIPWDDSVFIRSESHIVVRASLSIISALKQRGEVLKQYPSLRNYQVKDS